MKQEILKSKLYTGLIDTVIRYQTNYLRRIYAGNPRGLYNPVHAFNRFVLATFPEVIKKIPHFVANTTEMEEYSKTFKRLRRILLKLWSDFEHNRAELMILWMETLAIWEEFLSQLSAFHNDKEFKNIYLN